MFNFFEPDFSNPGDIAAAGLFSPEFQITSETTTIRLANFLRYGVFNSNGIAGDNVKGFHNDIELEFSVEKAMAHDPSALVDYLNNLLMAGQMPAEMKTIIVKYLNTLSMRTGTSNEDADRLARVRSAVHLIVTSPQFTIKR